MSATTAKMSFHLVNKIFNHLVEGLQVDMSGLQKIKQTYENNRKTRIVFMPIMKSYGDPLVMFYVNYYSNLDLGFTFGCHEDSPNNKALELILRKMGGVMIKRNIDNNPTKSNEIIDSNVLNYVN